jgi:hypothetical protein
MAKAVRNTARKTSPSGKPLGRPPKVKVKAVDVEPLLGILQANGDVKISAVVSKELHNDLYLFLRERGLTLTDFVRMAFKQSMRGYKVYGPDDILRFGKYNGEKLEYVIRMAPDYILWCRENMPNFRITDEAEQLFIALTEESMEEPLEPPLEVAETRAPWWVQ